MANRRVRLSRRSVEVQAHSVAKYFPIWENEKKFKRTFLGPYIGNYVQTKHLAK